MAAASEEGIGRRRRAQPRRARRLPRRPCYQLPANLTTLLDDVRRTTRQLTDLGQVRLVECADADLAARLATERTLRRLCWRVGDSHLAVPADKHAAFRKAVRALGYVMDRPTE